MQRVFAILLILGAFRFAIPQTTDSQPQQAQPKVSQSQQDIIALGGYEKALQSDSGDLEGMAQTFNNTGRGIDSDTALNVDHKAEEGFMEIDAAIWLLALATHMECDKDRSTATAAVKDRLQYYSHLLDLEANQIGPYLTFTRMPAVAQSGAHVRDQLRAAKAKMDEIAARL